MIPFSTWLSNVLYISTKLIKAHSRFWIGAKSVPPSHQQLALPRSFKRAAYIAWHAAVRPGGWEDEVIRAESQVEDLFKDPERHTDRTWLTCYCSAAKCLTSHFETHARWIQIKLLNTAWETSSRKLTADGIHHWSFWLTLVWLEVGIKRETCRFSTSFVSLCQTAIASCCSHLCNLDCS